MIYTDTVHLEKKGTQTEGRHRMKSKYAHKSKRGLVFSGDFEILFVQGSSLIIVYASVHNANEF